MLKHAFLCQGCLISRQKKLFPELNNLKVECRMDRSAFPISDRQRLFVGLKRWIKKYLPVISDRTTTNIQHVIKESKFVRTFINVTKEPLL